MSNVRINHGNKCCANCGYWEGRRNIGQNYTEAQGNNAKCLNRSSSCYNGVFTPHHCCSNYECHPLAKK